MKRITSFLVVLLCTGWFTSCAPEGQAKPEGLIPEGEMVMVLKDISLVEARFQRRLSMPGIHPNELVFENYKMVFDSHNIDIEQFKKSYSYYEENPEIMRNMYDSVIIVLTKEESALKETTEK